MQLPFRSFAWSVALTAVSLLALCLASETTQADEPIEDAPAERRVRVEFLDGTARDGELLRWTAEKIELKKASGSLLPDSAVRQYPVPLKIVSLPTIPSVRPTGNLVILSNDDRIVTTGLRVADDRLVGTWSGEVVPAEWTIPLELVQTCILQRPVVTAAHRELMRRIRGNQQRQDVLFLQNGDLVSGEFLEWTARTIKLQSSVGELQIPVEDVVAVRFNPELVSLLPKADRTARIHLTNGSRLTAEDWSLASEGSLTLQSSSLGQVSMPWKPVARIDIRSPQLVELTTLEPISSESRSFAGRPLMPQINRNVLGDALTCGGFASNLGIGMHSASRQTWPLSRRFSRFRTVVGMDDSTGHGGLADVSIEADGEVIWQSKGVSGGQPPVETGWLDVSAVDRLTLVVDFGAQADVLDRVNWCDPLLLRKDVQAN